MSLLDVRQLTVNFGAVSANLGIDLRVDDGAVVGLIGPNGAGKTTFIDAVTGFTRVSSGCVEFDGKDLTDARPPVRARAGMGRTFQSLELFEDLTVRENLLVAADRPRWHSILVDLVVPSRRRDLGAADVEWALELLGLDDVAERRPSELSHGRRKLVGVARALAMRPRLVLLDEPAAGLDTGETETLAGRIRSLREHGIAVLLVEHDMDLVTAVCDEVVALDVGVVIANGTPTAVLRDAAVVAAYLGPAAAARHGEVAGG